jgi:predicted transport protein
LIPVLVCRRWLFLRRVRRNNWHRIILENHSNHFERTRHCSPHLLTIFSVFWELLGLSVRRFYSTHRRDLVMWFWWDQWMMDDRRGFFSNWMIFELVGGEMRKNGGLKILEKQEVKTYLTFKRKQNIFEIRKKSRNSKKLKCFNFLKFHSLEEFKESIREHRHVPLHLSLINQQLKLLTILCIPQAIYLFFCMCLKIPIKILIQ